MSLALLKMKISNKFKCACAIFLFGANLALMACDKPKENVVSEELTMEVKLLNEQIDESKKALIENARKLGLNHPETIVLKEKVATMEHKLQLLTSYSSTQKTPAYSVEKEFDGNVINVDMFLDHPYLAEYKKVLQIKIDGKLVASKEIFDSGGFASFYFLRDDCKNIAVLDGVKEGFVILVKNKKVSDVALYEMPKNFPDHSFGRFAFDGSGPRTYKWVPNDGVGDQTKQIPCFHEKTKKATQ